jgi:hypothetical protein
MSWSTPSADLFAIATAVHAQADTLRTISVQIVIVSATTRWQSAAASSFRDRVRDNALSLRAAATRLDDAASLLERHAAKVASALETR